MPYVCTDSYGWPAPPHSARDGVRHPKSRDVDAREQARDDDDASDRVAHGRPRQASVNPGREGA